MTDGSLRTTIDLVAGQKTSGEPVLEEVLVTQVQTGCYRIEATPGVVLGMARGDLIEYDDVSKAFAVLERGGNLAVHVYGAHSIAECALDEVEQRTRSAGARRPGVLRAAASLARHGRIAEASPGRAAVSPGPVFGNDARGRRLVWPEAISSNRATKLAA